MNVKKALEKFKELEPVIVDGATFTTEHLDEIKLETGEIVYWVRDGGDLWLLLDPQSEEIILFHDIEEEIDASTDTITYSGEDYDLEYEAEVYILDEGEETDQVAIRDFAGPGGETPGKAVGLFYIGLATKDGVDSRKHNFSGSREENKRDAAQAVLSWLKEYLSGLPDR